MSWALFSASTAEMQVTLSGFYNSFGPYAPILPQWPSSGIAPSSFISLATGLNIALAKWETFLKTLLDLEDYIKKCSEEEIRKTKLAEPDLAAYLADEKSAHDLKSDFEFEREKVEKTAGAEMVGHRWWAFVFAWIGGSMLFLNFSAGIPGAALMIPLVKAYRTRSRAKKALRITIPVTLDRHVRRSKTFASSATLKATEIENRLSEPAKASKKGQGKTMRQP